jgi:release factor glutamine methyltransferase
MAHAERELSADEEARYRAAITRRTAGEPAQYITGVQEFYGREFAVTPAVLIPRPETEHIIEVCERLAKNLSLNRVLDIGTGSGCLAITLAKTLSPSHVVATDLSGPALEVASTNARRHSVAIDLVRCDLASALAGTFQLVVSNPPYVPELDKPALQPEVRDHEPEMALFAGPEGLDVYPRLFAESARLLETGGWLVCEIGVGQDIAVSAMAPSLGLCVVEVVRDLAGIPRTLVATRETAE